MIVLPEKSRVRFVAGPDFAKDWNSGVRVSEMVKKYGGSDRTIRYNAAKLGLPNRDDARFAIAPSDEAVAEAKRMREHRKSYREITEATGITRKQLEKLFKREPAIVKPTYVPLRGIEPLCAGHPYSWGAISADPYPKHLMGVR